MTRVLVVDDHAVVRQGVMQILSRGLGSVELGEASDADEAIRLARKEPWDVAVIDISMPGRSGLDLLDELRHERPGLPVLVLSMHQEDQMATRALRAGAAGYMMKDTAPKELVAAVTTLLAGGRYVTPSLAERLVYDLQRADERLPHERLSPREFEVLCMLGRGKTVSEIADALSLGVSTVSTHRARIIDKMDAHSTAELIQYAVRHGLVD